MSNFPLVRHKATDVWIPETDIDGVDVRENVMSNANNVEFSNGFFENMTNVRSVDLPSNVLQEIQNYDYEILDVKTFKHSTQGWQTLYILWHNTTGIKFYLSNTALDAYLLTSETTDAVIIDEKPERISYNLVNDQLKINLNVTGTYYSIISEKVIMNLTLCYLPEVAYSTTIKRNAGWYLTPRWLGWNYPVGDDSITIGSVGTTLYQTFEDSQALVSGQPYVLNNPAPVGWGRLETDESRNGNYCLALVGSAIAFDYNNNIIFGQSGITKYTFYAKGIFSSASISATIDIYTRNANSFAWQLATSVPLTSSYQLITIDTPPYGQMKIVGKLSGYIPNPFGDDESYEIYIDDLTGFLEDYATEESGAVLLAKYFDGQRAKIKSDNIIYEADSVTVTLEPSQIDYRISSYELYTLDANGIYILIAELSVDGGWEDVSGNVRKTEAVVFSETTLNFKYNLPYDARVDNQKYIYSEITHKGRVYFVNNDYKIYQSHISTNLAIQADAFPYDEETGFGYFIVDHSKINLALANSPTNDMVIITNQGFYLYFIQPSGSGSFKQLKMGSGSLSISSLKTLTSSLNGEPATDGLFWIDANGIYFYGGGLTPPENLITEGHLRYWQSFTVEQKENAVAFYNPTKKEYWLYIDDKFLIYELSFKKFRLANGLSGLTTFVGYRDLIPYYMSSGNTLIACDGTTRIAGQIESHYNTVEGNPEIYHKIMQEIYIEFGTSDGGAIVGVEIYVDDRLAQTYYFNTNSRYDKYLAPIALRFNRAKMKVLLPANKYVRVKEFGYSFSLDVAEPLAIVPVSIAESGYGFDYGNSYGN